MRIKKGVIFIILLALVLAGCSDIRVPTFRYATTHPWDTKTPLRMGLTKQAIIKKWGEPDEVIPNGWDEAGLKKEKWIYRAWFPNFPIDYRYLSKSKCLFFVGDSLIDLKDLDEVKKEEAK